MHPHKDMEILTYIVSGELKHQDSMGNTSVISPGRIQYMSAGSGVLHSEFNPSEVNPVHLLQIWIIPNEKGLAPRYEELNFPTNQTLALLASGNEKDGGITIRQDAKLYRGLLKKGEEVELPLLESRKGWLQLIIGTLEVQGKVKAEKGDGIAFEAEDAPKVKVLEDAEFLFFDLPNE
jgi:redox-sensitive bicupin YhaK (pirin superfamily)